MTRPTRPSLRVSSMVWRAAFLAAAWIWAGAVVAFYFDYHIAEPSSPWLVANGHTYFTHPPAQTLAQRDHVSAELVSIALALAVVVGALDLVVRLVRRMTGPGVTAISAGGMLVLFSLFGLVRGLAGIGTVGLLVILSGLPMRPSAPADPDPPVPASWCVDPTGRCEYRYWDGSSWSRHVADSGRASIDPP